MQQMPFLSHDLYNTCTYQYVCVGVCVCVCVYLQVVSCIVLVGLLVEYGTEHLRLSFLKCENVVRYCPDYPQPLSPLPLTSWGGGGIREGIAKRTLQL